MEGGLAPQQAHGAAAAFLLVPIAAEPCQGSCAVSSSAASINPASSESAASNEGGGRRGAGPQFVSRMSAPRSVRSSSSAPGQRTSPKPVTHTSSAPGTSPLSPHGTTARLSSSSATIFRSHAPLRSLFPDSSGDLHGAGSVEQVMRSLGASSLPWFLLLALLIFVVELLIAWRLWVLYCSIQKIRQIRKHSRPVSGKRV